MADETERYILLSRATTDPMERRTANTILEALGRLDIECDHVDEADLAPDQDSPALLTPDARFNGFRAIWEHLASRSGVSATHSLPAGAPA
ncbi:hypothetical protein HY478_03400 [Candidatus Uhrbacteria bacterium]|nr:hypothetical protein [Candidatus Uhrbacteria bacterium]